MFVTMSKNKDNLLSLKVNNLFSQISNVMLRLLTVSLGISHQFGLVYEILTHPVRPVLKTTSPEVDLLWPKE